MVLIKDFKGEHMNRKNMLIVFFVILFVFSAAVVMFASRRPPEPPTPSDPDERVAPTQPAPPPPPTTFAATIPSESKDNKQKTNSDKPEELDFYQAFSDYPRHFVSHGVRPGDEMSSAFFFHVTMEISDNGVIKGTYFNNTGSDDDTIIEETSNWTAGVRDKKIYLDTDGSYYFYLKDVKYDHKPETSEKDGDKTVKYVYGYGLNAKADNKIRLYAPGTPLGDIELDKSDIDLPEYLINMRKNGEGELLDCFLLIGTDDRMAVSISDEEAAMAAQEQNGNDEGQPQPPDPPEHP